MMRSLFLFLALVFAFSADSAHAARRSKRSKSTSARVRAIDKPAPTIHASVPGCGGQQGMAINSHHDLKRLEQQINEMRTEFVTRAEAVDSGTLAKLGVASTRSILDIAVGSAAATGAKGRSIASQIADEDDEKLAAPVAAARKVGQGLMRAGYSRLSHMFECFRDRIETKVRMERYFDRMAYRGNQ